MSVNKNSDHNSDQNNDHNSDNYNDHSLDNIEIIDILDISNNVTISNNYKKDFLRKGQGKLASHNHGITKFSISRKNSFVFEQETQSKNEINSYIKINNFIK